MRKTKIVFVDLDGTLAKEDRTIDIVNKKVIDKLASIGVGVVLITGRSILYSESICKQYGLSNYLIASNGADIYNYINKKIIYRNIISKEDIIKINDYVKKYDLYFTVYIVDKNYTNKKDSPFIYIKDFIELKELKITQIVIQSLDIEKMKLFRKDISNTNLKIINKTRNIKKGELLYYDLVNKDVSKGTALKVLCNYLKMDIDKVMVIGDSYNDESMFDIAGYRVAVENAIPELKEKADFITMSNDNNGVYLVLNNLYLELMKRS